MGVKVLVQDLGGLFVEVSSFPPMKTEQARERERKKYDMFWDSEEVRLVQLNTNVTSSNNRSSPSAFCSGLYCICRLCLANVLGYRWQKKTRATSHSEHFIIHEEALHTRAEGGLKALEERKAVVGASFTHLLG